MSGQVCDYDLIKLVQSYPILYDKDQARGHKNASMKDKAWREVSLQLKKSERACITRWKSIRDRFGKEYRRVQDNPDEPTNWDMFPHLLFLKDHYKHGNANNEAIISIKYEPKARKRKTRRLRDQDASDEEQQNEEDVDPEELMLNQQLIALVREHNVLYDRHKIRDSKNLTAKNEAWSEISSSLGVSEELCYKRWKKLRDRFAREFRQYQLYPEKPVTWIYFQDLMFLESHYRKGIPLPVDTMRRRVKNQQIDEDPWGTELSSFACTEEDEQIISEEHINEMNEMPSQSFDELLVIPAKKELTDKNLQITYVSPESAPTLIETTPVAGGEPEERLSNAISNIESALRESQDCLKALQQQKQRHKQELLDQNRAFDLQPDMLQKVHLLLHGLDAEERNKAERKILQFLCECQIKSLNNEEIEDVGGMHIFN